MSWILNNLEVIAIIVFYSFLAWFFYHNRKHVTRQMGIAFLLPTKKGIKVINWLATKFKTFWKVYGYLAIPTGFLGMIFIFWILIQQIFVILANPSAGGGTSIILPGTRLAQYGPFMTVSIWYFLVAIGVLVLVHEGSHALVARAHGLKINHTGVGLFAIIPMAFVEPDEAKLEKAPLKTKLSVFAAGPFANIITGIVFLALSTFLVLPAVAGAVQYDKIMLSPQEDSGAEAAGLQGGEVLLTINGVAVDDGKLAVNYGVGGFPPSAYSRLGAHSSKLSEELASVGPNQDVSIVTDRGEFTIRTTAKKNEPEKGYLGVNLAPYVTNKDNLKLRSLVFAHDMLLWIFLFNIGVGLFNLLPLGPLDGGLMLRNTLLKLMNKRQKLALRAISAVSMIALVVLFFNLFGKYIAALFI